MFQAPGIAVPNDLDEAQVARVTAPGSQAFADLLLMLRLVEDPAAFQAKLDQLTARAVKADEATKALIRQQAANTARENEFDALQKQLAERMLAVTQAEAVIAEERQRLLDIQRDIREHGDRYKRERLRYAGLRFNEQLQDLPDWDALARLVLGQADAHMENNEGSPREQEGSVTEQPENAIVGSTLMRSRPATAAERKSTRRSKPSKPSRSDLVRGT